ncbi:hypothetical protein ACFQ1M_05710 [Sungkyunkwania multivorans]|uniref:Uncharacterized protein n=1 Tax=Sungkyunkwania multivorans TaxID=1173618 RepID=A0ABW3CYI6_9FLAO
MKKMFFFRHIDELRYYKTILERNKQLKKQSIEDIFAALEGINKIKDFYDREDPNIVMPFEVFEDFFYDLSNLFFKENQSDYLEYLKHSNPELGFFKYPIESILNVTNLSKKSVGKRSDLHAFQSSYRKEGDKLIIYDLPEYLENEEAEGRLQKVEVVEIFDHTRDINLAITEFFKSSSQALRKLIISAVTFNDTTLKELLNSKLFGQLDSLNLQHTDISSKGLLNLMNTDRCGLLHFSLRNVKGLGDLLNKPQKLFENFLHLETIGLENSELGDQFLVEFSNIDFFQLKNLSLSNNSFSPNTFDYLRNSKWIKELEIIKLNYTGLQHNAFNYYTKNFYNKLKRLEIGGDWNIEDIMKIKNKGLLSENIYFGEIENIII